MKDGMTALWISSIKGHKDVVSALLAAGATVDIQDNVSTITFAT